MSKTGEDIFGLIGLFILIGIIFPALALQLFNAILMGVTLGFILVIILIVFWFLKENENF